MAHSSRVKFSVSLTDLECTCVAFSPGDGCFMAVSMGDASIALLCTQSGAVIRRLHGHSDNVQAVVFLTTGMLVSCSCDSTVRIWDAGSGECVSVMRGHTTRVLTLAFQPKSSKFPLASGGGDGTVRLWLDSKTAGWRELKAGPMLDGHITPVYSVAFKADGTLLASAAKSDPEVKLWHLPEGTPGRVFHTTPSGLVRFVAFSPVEGSDLLVCSSLGKLKLWSANHGNVVREIDHMGLNRIAFAPDGSLLLAAGNTNVLHVWINPGKSQLPIEFPMQYKHVSNVAVSHSGKQAALCTYYGSLELMTLCKWSDRDHHLFGAEFRARVFYIMCVRERLIQAQHIMPFLPMEMWLEIFVCLQLAL